MTPTRSQSPPDRAASTVATVGHGISTAAIMVALVMAACFVALSHDASYVGTGEEVSVERGAGLKEHEKFEEDVNAAPAQRKIAFLVMIGVGFYCLLTRKEQVTLHFGPTVMLMFACLGIVLASFFWSIDRGETMREIVRIVAYVFIAASLSLRFRPRELCTVLVTMGLASVTCALSVEILTGNFRPWAGDFRLKGSIHSNVLASHAMVAALICFAFRQSVSKPWLIKAVLVAMVSVIILTKTRGALATSCVGMGTIYFASKSPRAGLLAVSLLLTTICLVSLLYVAAGSQAQNRIQGALLMGRSEGATTLTGRLPLWQELWFQSRDHRWLGHGYGAFWTIDQMQKLEDKLRWYPGHSHSVYMQTILDVGVFGILIFIALVLSCLARARRLIRRTQDPAYYFVLGFLTAGFVDGIVEVSFVYPRGLGLLVAISMFSLILVRAPARSLASKPKRKIKAGEYANFATGQQGQLSLN